MRRDWGSLGRRLCDVLARCEATGNFQPSADGLANLRDACEEEIGEVCQEAESAPSGEFYAGVVVGQEPPALPEKVADFTHRGPGL